VFSPAMGRDGGLWVRAPWFLAFLNLSSERTDLVERSDWNPTLLIYSPYPDAVRRSGGKAGRSSRMAAFA